MADLSALIRRADTVELKATVPVSDRTKGAAALGVDPLEGEIRQVYFFDTPRTTLERERRRRFGLAAFSAEDGIDRSREPLRSLPIW